MKRNLLSAVLALFATLAFSLGAQAQTAVDRNEPQTTNAPAPVRQMIPQRMQTDQFKPFACPPIVEFVAFKGNVGNDVERTVGAFRFNTFTSDSLNSPYVRVAEFRTFTFTTAAGTTIIGRPEALSWIELKLERPGWVVFRYWIQGITIQTSEENHLRGGAIEGQFALYRDVGGNICLFETWSVPELIHISSLGRTLIFGAFEGNAPLMFDKLCLWRIPTWIGENHLAFNQVTTGTDSIIWQPFEVYLPGTSLRYNIGWLKVTFPDC